MSETIQLFLEWFEREDAEARAESPFAGADGLVVDPCQCGLERFEQTGAQLAVIRHGDLQRDAAWLERSAWWVEEGGLEQAARIRDRNPGLEVVPRLEVAKAQTSYRFSGPAIGAGFSFYVPDTAAIRGWEVIGSDGTLREALIRATELGFTNLWLHSPAAESRAKGLELDLLEQVQGGPLGLWLSGGASDAQHLRNLVRAGGCCAVVIGETLARTSKPDELRDALLPQAPEPEAVPIHFDRQRPPRSETA